MQIDLNALGIIVSVLGLIVTLYTIVRTNAKSEQKMQGQIDIVKNDIHHLSEKVEKHNQMVERTYKLEQETAVLKEEMKVEQHRTQDLEEGLEKTKDKLINMTRRNAV